MTPEDIFNRMYDNDAFSKWLGIECVDIMKGSCTLKMVIKEEMLNGFGIAHGAITYAIADSALAFAANSHGQHALSIETQISHIKPCKAGDTIIAIAKELSFGQKLARYQIDIKNDKNDIVAIFYGTVFRKKDNWHIS